MALDGKWVVNPNLEADVKRFRDQVKADPDKKNSVVICTFTPSERLNMVRKLEEKMREIYAENLAKEIIEKAKK